MLPLLKNELRLRVGPQACEASLWRAGWPARCTGAATARGGAGVALELALGTLIADGHELPRRASLCADDEFLYYATLPANGSFNDSVAQARAHFTAMLDADDWLVLTHLAPCGRIWLAVAIAAELVDGWRATLAERGVELRHVRAALFDDIWRLRAELPKGEGLVVLLRREGVMMVGLRQGVIVDIAWERCAVDDAAVLRARVQGHRELLSFELAESAENAELEQSSAQPLPLPLPLILPVFVAAADAAQQAEVATLAAGQGWQWLSLPSDSYA